MKIAVVTGADDTTAEADSTLIKDDGLAWAYRSLGMLKVNPVALAFTKQQAVLVSLTIAYLGAQRAGQLGDVFDPVDMVHPQCPRIEAGVLAALANDEGVVRQILMQDVPRRVVGITLAADA